MSYTSASSFPPAKLLSTTVFRSRLVSSFSLYGMKRARTEPRVTKRNNSNALPQRPRTNAGYHPNPLRAVPPLDLHHLASQLELPDTVADHLLDTVDRWPETPLSPTPSAPQSFLEPPQKNKTHIERTRPTPSPSLRVAPVPLQRITPSSKLSEKSSPQSPRQSPRQSPLHQQHSPVCKQPDNHAPLPQKPPCHDQKDTAVTTTPVPMRLWSSLRRLWDALLPHSNASTQEQVPATEPDNKSSLRVSTDSTPSSTTSRPLSSTPSSSASSAHSVASIDHVDPQPSSASKDSDPSSEQSAPPDRTVAPLTRPHLELPPSITVIPDGLETPLNSPQTGGSTPRPLSDSFEHDLCEADLSPAARPSEDDLAQLRRISTPTADFLRNRRNSAPLLPLRKRFSFLPPSPIVTPNVSPPGSPTSRTASPLFPSPTIQPLPSLPKPVLPQPAAQPSHSSHIEPRSSEEKQQYNATTCPTPDELQKKRPAPVGITLQDPRPEPNIRTPAFSQSNYRPRSSLLQGRDAPTMIRPVRANTQPSYGHDSAFRPTRALHPEPLHTPGLAAQNFGNVRGVGVGIANTMGSPVTATCRNCQGVSSSLAANPTAFWTPPARASTHLSGLHTRMAPSISLDQQIAQLQALQQQLQIQRRSMGVSEALPSTPMSSPLETSRYGTDVRESRALDALSERRRHELVSQQRRLASSMKVSKVGDIPRNVRLPLRPSHLGQATRTRLGHNQPLPLDPSLFV